MTDLLGLQYLRARYYSPQTGQFNRLDPFFGNLDDPLSLHKYAYVHGDPISGVDPSGEFRVSHPGLFGLIPVVVSAWDLIYNIQQGNGFQAALSAAILVSDFFLVGSVFRAGGYFLKHGLKNAGKMSIMIGPGRPYGIHAVWEVAGKLFHGNIDPAIRSIKLGTLTIQTAEGILKVWTPWIRTWKLPVIITELASACGGRAFSCVTSAFAAFLKGNFYIPATTLTWLASRNPTLQNLAL